MTTLEDQDINNLKNMRMEGVKGDYEASVESQSLPVQGRGSTDIAN